MALFYDREYGRNWNRGYDRGYRSQAGWNDFDRNSRTAGGRYDQGFKSRWQTDYGDPFNDRGSRTPIRMTRGEFRGSNERDFGWGSNERDFGWGSNYDRDYSANPMGYDPYFDQSRRGQGMGMGRWNRYDRGYRGRGRSYRGGYDEGWF